MAKIEINGKEYNVLDGINIIEAADDNSVYIPRFCYHKKLSVAANCRMCLVDVEGAPKALPACATPVADGMKINTKSERTIQAQKAIMEFLLINHPLDCPICDQGGQCELQDLAMGYGADVSQYDLSKRVVRDPDLGPFISTDMTRCIHCTRCVRFGSEIAGVRELGGMDRGGHMKIGTYVKHTVKSELSGNVIDICPVGALTSKPFRFKARAWELNQHNSIAPHDCIGSNVHLGVLRDKVLRVGPRENEALNEVWLSDRDRFSYAGLHSEQRVKKPMIKKGGKWQTVSWLDAFDAVVEGLQKVLNDDPSKMGALASPSSTTEELYLLQKLMRSVGVNNIDYRLRQTDFSDQKGMPVCGDLGVKLAELEARDVILLVGSDIQREQPLAGLRVRKAALNGANIFALNMRDYDFNFDLAGSVIVKPSAMVDAIAGIAKSVLEQSGKTHAEAAELLKNTQPSEQAKAIAKALLDSDKASIVFGIQAFNHPEAATLRRLGVLISSLSGATVGCLPEGANAQGASIAGCLPHRSAAGEPMSDVGLDVAAMLKQEMKAFVLLGAEPEFDCANSSDALHAMKQADCVVAINSFMTEAMKAYADVILPMAAFGETSGTFVNVEGTWQSFKGAVQPTGEARPAWKILRVLGNLLGSEGFDYTSSEDVLNELKARSENVDYSVAHWDMPLALPRVETGSSVERVTEIPMYRTDALCRQSAPLQSMNEAINSSMVIRMNQKTADHLNVKADQKVVVTQAKGNARLLVMIDESLPFECVQINGATEAGMGLGELFGKIEVSVD